MNILIYTPIDETFEYTHAAIIKELNKTLNLTKNDITSVVLFANFLLIGNLAHSTEESVLFAIATINKYLRALDIQKTKNLIIIGNCTKDIHFDLIVGYSQDTFDKPQSDLLINKMRERCAESEMISSLLNDLYQPKDCECFLNGIEKLVDFIGKVANNDVGQS